MEGPKSTLCTPLVSVIEYRKPLIFYNELAANPHLAPEEDINLVSQERRQILPLLEKETVSLTACLLNILEKSGKVRRFQ